MFFRIPIENLVFWYLSNPSVEFCAIHPIIKHPKVIRYNHSQVELIFLNIDLWSDTSSNTNYACRFVLSYTIISHLWVTWRIFSSKEDESNLHSGVCKRWMNFYFIQSNCLRSLVKISVSHGCERKNNSFFLFCFFLIFVLLPITKSLFTLPEEHIHSIFLPSAHMTYKHNSSLSTLSID